MQRHVTCIHVSTSTHTHMRIDMNGKLTISKLPLLLKTTTFKAGDSSSGALNMPTEYTVNLYGAHYKSLLLLGQNFHKYKRGLKLFYVSRNSSAKACIHDLTNVGHFRAQPKHICFKNQKYIQESSKGEELKSKKFQNSKMQWNLEDLHLSKNQY